MLVSLAAAFAVSAVLVFAGTSQAREPGATDLTITKKVNPAKVKVGETLTYRITALNEGRENARGVQVTDQLPSGVKFISTVNTHEVRCSGGQTVRCNFGTFKPGTGVKIKIQVRAVKKGRFVNRAFVSHNTIEEDPSDNSDTATHRAVKKAAKKGGGNRCGVKAVAGNNGATACVGGVKATARR